MASPFAGLANLVARSGAGRWLNEQVTGVDRRRMPPRWTSRPLRERVTGRTEEPQALLFVDTFTNYYDPEIGEAALEILAAAGVRAALAPNVCCGRTLISQGLLAEARELAARNAELVRATASRGVPLIFCEPSCLSAIREDAPALLRGESRTAAEAVARSSKLFEEYAATKTENLKLNEGPKSILLHGHCHQKAMGLLAPAKRLLDRVPGAKVVDLDAGCCGMAGSFGYAKEHFEVSRAIGERKLLPAARAMGPQDVLVASGHSCRHQVEDFAGKHAVHPAILLRDLLRSRSS
jgi:Fe-S oxidoreductase